MNRADENKVRRLVHGFLHSEITAVEFKKELALVSDRKPRKKIRRGFPNPLSTASTTDEDVGVNAHGESHLENERRSSFES